MARSESGPAGSPAPVPAAEARGGGRSAAGWPWLLGVSLLLGLGFYGGWWARTLPWFAAAKPPAPTGAAAERRKASIPRNNPRQPLRRNIPTDVVVHLHQNKPAIAAVSGTTYAIATRRAATAALGLGDVHAQVAAVEVLAVEHLDGLGSLVGRAHLDEAEAARLA